MTSPAQRRQAEFDKTVELAEAFAARIDYTIREAFGGSENVVQAFARKRNVVVAPSDPGGLRLRIDGSAVFRLKVTYYCGLSSNGRHLAVDRSSIAVLHVAHTEPLFHFDYEHDPRSAPAAHINIHTQSAGFDAAIRDSRRPRGRGGNSIQPRELHFPVGGHRFRPCLEDVLEMLIVEFGVEHQDGWRVELNEGRAIWRNLQLKTAIADQPEASADALRDLGYEVSWPAERPAPRQRDERFNAY